MKTALLWIIALAMIGATSANVSYFQANQDVWTLQTSVWPVIYTSYDASRWLTSQYVACNKVRKMCYTETSAKRLKFDVVKFIRWQEEFTGVKVLFKDLWAMVNLR